MQLTISQSLKCHWISVPKKKWKLSLWTNTNVGGAGAMLPTGQHTNNKNKNSRLYSLTVSLAMHEYLSSRLDALLPALCNSLGAWRKMLSILLHALPKTSSVVMLSSTVWLHPSLCWVLWDWWCRKPNETHHELDMVVGLCPPDAPRTVHRPVASLRWWLFVTLAWQDTS